MAEGLLAMPTKREAQCDAQKRRPTVDDNFTNTAMAEGLVAMPTKRE